MNQSPQYKINIEMRNYTQWSLTNIETGEQVMDARIITACAPIRGRFFNGDILTVVGETMEAKVATPSPVRQQRIPGVLMLKGNRTYGRMGANNSPRAIKQSIDNKGKPLYKVVPNDPTLPEFLIPYKVNEYEFNKAYKNCFVIIQFAQWETAVANGHPVGELVETIGTVDEIPHYLQYELECSQLVHPIPKKMRDAQFNHCRSNTTKTAAAPNSTTPIFSIDSEETRDYDDAFSIKQDAALGTRSVTIYISNVGLVLARMGLLDAVSQRVATIYMPNNKVSMFPRYISEYLCSLRRGDADENKKPAFTMTIEIPECVFQSEVGSGTINMDEWRISFKNVDIEVTTNYTYESAELLADPNYKLLIETTQAVFNYGQLHASKLGQNRVAPMFNFPSAPKNSHEVVAYWMLYMNYTAAQLMFDSVQPCIFRKDNSAIHIQPQTVGLVPQDIQRSIALFNAHSMGEYTTSRGSCQHTTLDLPYYMQLTSPIRRIGDLVNIIAFQLAHGMLKEETESAEVIEAMRNFLPKWTDAAAIKHINDDMQKIRRVQNRANLLTLCSNISMTNANNIYMGYLFNRRINEMRTKMHKYTWSVYVPELKMFSTVETDEQNLSTYNKVGCRLIVINDEMTFRRKVRIQMVEYGL